MTSPGLHHRAATPPLPARRARTRLLDVIGAVLLVAGLVAFVPSGAAPAAAATPSTFTSAAVTIPDHVFLTNGVVDTGLVVSGLGGRLIDLQVRLNDLTHTFPDDLNFYLTSPAGTHVVLAADAGGSSNVSNIDVTFDDSAGTHPPDDGALSTATYRPGFVGLLLSSPPGDTATHLGAFAGEDPNGTWTLRVVDDAGNDVGTIGGGFSLLIETSPFCTTGGAIPDNNTSTGRLLTIPVAGIPTDLTDVDVVLYGLDEDDAEDLDAFVAAPNGAYSYLVSDVGGWFSSLRDVAVEIDDEAATTIAGTFGSFVSGRFRPSNLNNLEGGHTYPAGFTSGPNTTLSALDASSAVGDWRVWLVDDNNDGGGGSVGGACLDLTASNTAPTAGPAGDLTTPEDTVLPITLPGSDVDSQALSYEITLQPSAGTITQVSGANWHYTPPADFDNPSPEPGLTFTYQVSDGTASATNSGTIRVTPVNDAPDAPDQTVSTAEDTPLGVTLSSTDVDGPDATFTITDDPDHGVLTGADGSRSYQPTADYVGADSFTFQVADGAGGTDTATISVTVTAVDDAPTADGDSYDATEDTTLVITAPGVLDGDDDGDPEVTETLTAELVTNATNGVVTLAADGSFTYEPGADFTGIDSFTYVADDGPLQSAPATVAIDVGNVNDAPDADDQSLNTDEDTLLAVTLSGVDTEGDTLTFDITLDPTHGTVSGAGAEWTYTPAAEYHGPDSFTFTVTDPSGEVASGIVEIDVAPVNDDPVGRPDTQGDVVVDEDGTLVVPADGVLANDDDVDGDPLSAALATTTSHGTVTLAADGSFTYVPDADYNGTDSFTYVVSDGVDDGAGGAGTAAVAPATAVLITVNPMNDTPVAVDDEVTVAAGAAVTVSVLGNDTDPDGDALVVVTHTPANRGTVGCAAGTCTFTAAAADPGGAVTFDYAVEDAGGLADAGTVTVTVLAATPEVVSTPTGDPTPATEIGDAQLPRTGAGSSNLWVFGAVLIGIGCCTSGTGAVLRVRARRPRHAR